MQSCCILYVSWKYNRSTGILQIEREKMKKFAAPLLKLLIAAAIVAFLVTRNSEGLLAAFRAIHPGWLAAAFVLYGIHIWANAWRWHLLLRVRDIDCSMAEAFSLTMQSFFFSLVIPGGAIGGDLVRIGFLTARVPKEQKFVGAFTILMDRFTGMIGIFLMALVMLPLCLTCLDMGSGVMRALIWLLLGGSACGLLAAVVVFWHHLLERIALYRALQSFADRMTHGLFTKVSDAIDSYRGNRKEIIICIAASMILVNAVLGVAGFFVAHGVNASWNEAGITIEAITLGNIAGLLPLTPSGVGARDFIVKNILESSGMDARQALATALSFTMIIIAFNLLGGLFFVFDKHKKQSGS